MSTVIDRIAAPSRSSLGLHRNDYALATNTPHVSIPSKPEARVWNSLGAAWTDIDSCWARLQATNARASNEVMVFIYNDDMNELVAEGVLGRDRGGRLNIFPAGLQVSYPAFHAAEHLSSASVIAGDVLGDIKWLKENFSLSMSEMSSLFGVTRKAVYDWFDGSRPRHAMAERIAAVRELLTDRVSTEHRRFIRQFWGVPVGNGPSLIDILKSQELSGEWSAKSAEAIDVINPKIAQYIERNQKTRQKHAIGNGNTDDIFRSI